MFWPQHPRRWDPISYQSTPKKIHILDGVKASSCWIQDVFWPQHPRRWDPISYQSTPKKIHILDGVKASLCWIQDVFWPQHPRRWYQNTSPYAQGAGTKTRLHTPKAVTYYEQPYYCRFMIGHSLGRMESRLSAILI